MKYTMTKPCESCPFRTDKPFYLAASRRREIADALISKQQTFQCHKTIDYGAIEDEEGNCTDRTNTRRAQHCAGAMIVMEKMNKPNQMMRVCERLGFYDRNKLEMDSPVFDSMSEFVKAGKGQR